MKYNKLIDHTLLKQDAKPEQIVALCEEAKQFDFMSVCVNPAYVPLAHSILEGSDVKVCTVIGFPLGMNLTKTKVEEAELAIKEGADEIDMVINVGMLKAGHDDYVRGTLPSATIWYMPPASWIARNCFHASAASESVRFSR